MPLPFGTSTQCQRLVQDIMRNYRGPSESLRTHPYLSTNMLRTPDFLFWGHHGSTVSSQTSVGHPNHFLLLWHYVASHALLNVLPCSVDGTRHGVLHDSLEALQGLSTCFGSELNGFVWNASALPVARLLVRLEGIILARLEKSQHAQHLCSLHGPCPSQALTYGRCVDGLSTWRKAS